MVQEHSVLLSRATQQALISMRSSGRKFLYSDFHPSCLSVICRALWPVEVLEETLGCMFVRPSLSNHQRICMRNEGIPENGASPTLDGRLESGRLLAQRQEVCKKRPADLGCLTPLVQGDPLQCGPFSLFRVSSFPDQSRLHAAKEKRSSNVAARLDKH